MAFLAYGYKYIEVVFDESGCLYFISKYFNWFL